VLVVVEPVADCTCMFSLIHAPPIAISDAAFTAEATVVSVIVVTPATFAAPPTYTFFATPSPPAVVNDAVAASVASVASVTPTKPPASEMVLPLVAVSVTPAPLVAVTSCGFPTRLRQLLAAVDNTSPTD